MTNIIKIIITFFSILTVFTSTAFCDELEKTSFSGNTNQSIKELKNWLLELNRNKNELEIEFFLLNQNEKLKEFFKDDLKKSDIKEIKQIINNYLDIKKDINVKIKIKASEFLNTQKERNKLLNEKKQFYKDLTPFVKKYKINEYLDYIAQDVKILKEQGEISEKFIIKNEIMVNKVEIIEEKIKEHREYLDEKFNFLVNNLISEKTNKLINSDNFTKLDNITKKIVINKILIKIHITISNLEKKVDKTDALVKKLEIYQRVYSKFNEILNELDLQKK